MRYDALLQERLKKREAGRIDVRSHLDHFALINYAVPISRLEPFIPTQRFQIMEFEPGMAMLSVVPFIDVDFAFYRLLPWLQFRFPQTNHRIYVLDKKTGQPVVWFLGTTLGSRVVHIARSLWRIPWYAAKYQVDCRYDETRAIYDHYQMQIESAWCSAEIEVVDTGEAVDLTAEERLVITHPIDGFFYRLDGRTGGYGIWHDIIPLSVAHPTQLYFSLYERLGIMSKEEMQEAHSIYLCPRILFEIYMPPRAVGSEEYSGEQ